MADFYNIVYSTFLHVWATKVQIIGSAFYALTIYSYFYRKYLVKKEIIRLKKEAIVFEIYTHNLINRAMGEQEKFSIKEMVKEIASDFKEFKSETREGIKDLTKMFSDYTISNNDRISLLEGKQRTTTKTIVIYTSFIGMFIMLVVNTYMSLT